MLFTNDLVGATFVQLAAKQFANLFVWISFRCDSEGITRMLEENERRQELGNHRRLIMRYISVSWISEIYFVSTS